MELLFFYGRSAGSRETAEAWQKYCETMRHFLDHTECSCPKTCGGFLLNPMNATTIGRLGRKHSIRRTTGFQLIRWVFGDFHHWMDLTALLLDLFSFVVKVRGILLMAEILHQLIGSLSHCFWGFIHPRWCRISAINSMTAEILVFFCVPDRSHQMWPEKRFRVSPEGFGFYCVSYKSPLEAC